MGGGSGGISCAEFFLLLIITSGDWLAAIFIWLKTLAVLLPGNKNTLVISTSQAVKNSCCNSFNFLARTERVTRFTLVTLKARSASQFRVLNKHKHTHMV